VNHQQDLEYLELLKIFQDFDLFRLSRVLFHIFLKENSQKFCFQEYNLWKRFFMSLHYSSSSIDDKMSHKITKFEEFFFFLIDLRIFVNSIYHSQVERERDMIFFVDVLIIEGYNINMSIIINLIL